jgi:hypothetical protein
MTACPTSQANAGHRPTQDATDFEEPGAGIEDRTVICCAAALRRPSRKHVEIGTA